MDVVAQQRIEFPCLVLSFVHTRTRTCSQTMASFTFAVPNIVFGQGKAAEMYVLLEGVRLGRFIWRFVSFFQHVLN